MSKEYQFDYSKITESVFDQESRQRKAETTLKILEDTASAVLKELKVLDVGASTGIIDHYLAEHFDKVFGIDIDTGAIDFAFKESIAENLFFAVGDALNIPFEDQQFDVVICSHVYEHVPDPERMIAEIHRTLKTGGICYFAAGNRLAFNEPHHNLPLLSIMPRALSHLYLRLTGKGSYYHEQHYTFWGLKKLTNKFGSEDYTLKCVYDPVKFSTDYMIKPNSLKQKLAILLLRFFYWASPGYIWVLKK